MKSDIRYTVFSEKKHIVTGDLKQVLTETKAYLDENEEARVLIFDNRTGKQVDFNFRGTLEEVLDRALPSKPKKGPGRPKLGVVGSEVTLLPRHWEWLSRQPHGASGTIRRLVDNARKNMSPEDRAQVNIEAADWFMRTMAGNLVGYEEAARALYAQKWIIFDRLIANWPEDITEHLNRMIRPVRNP